MKFYIVYVNSKNTEINIVTSDFISASSLNLVSSVSFFDYSVAFDEAIDIALNNKLNYNPAFDEDTLD